MAAVVGGGLIGKQSAGAMHTGGNQHLIINEVFRNTLEGPRASFPSVVVMGSF